MRDTTSAGATAAAALTTGAGGTSAGLDAPGRVVRADRIRLTDHPTFNEHWLRERIVDDPSVLGLGDLRLADESRTHDGRLELLLRDPATGRRITALVRIGPAEAGDLVRAIENWTIERARYPEHEHFAVIVAEELPPRFLSAANTLGTTIPLSAMQVSVLRVAEHVTLHFAVVIDRLPPRVVPASVEQAPRNGAGGEKPGLLSVTPDHSPTEPAAPAKPSSNGATSASHAATEETAAANGTDVVAIAPATAVAPDAAVAPEAVSSRVSATDPWDDRPVSANTDLKLPTWLSDRPDGRGDDDEPARVRGGRLLSFVALVSLVLCVAAVFGWVRSYGARDAHTFADAAGRDHFLYSDQGHIEWISPAPPADPGGGRAVRVPYWLPAGLTAILPFAWLIRRAGRHHD
jgi:hypothetical protein